MQKFVWTILIVAVLGYLYSDGDEKPSPEAIKAAKIKQAAQTAVSQMTLRTGAIKNWDESLSDEPFRLEPILTIELEKLWLQGKPILFIGSITDVATHIENQYIVSIRRGISDSSKHVFMTKLELALTADQNKIDSFLKDHPNLFKEEGFNNGVAVVARINSIKTQTYYGENSGSREARIGEGELIDIVYTGDVFF